MRSIKESRKSQVGRNGSPFAASCFMKGVCPGFEVSVAI